MATVAFWISMGSLAVTVGILVYVIRTMGRYKMHTDRLAHNLIKMTAAMKAHIDAQPSEHTLGEIKQWHSLFVRLIFEALRVVESKLDKAFWRDLEDKYPDLELFSNKKIKPNGETKKKK